MCHGWTFSVLSVSSVVDPCRDRAVTPLRTRPEAVCCCGWPARGERGLDRGDMKPHLFALRYPDTDIRPAAGDRVRYVEVSEAMVVEEVVDTRERMARWGVSEAGLVLAGGAFGTVFEPLTERSEVVFVSRGEGIGPQPPDAETEGERPPGSEKE